MPHGCLLTGFVAFMILYTTACFFVRPPGLMPHLKTNGCIDHCLSVWGHKKSLGYNCQTQLLSSFDIARPQLYKLQYATPFRDWRRWLTILHSIEHSDRLDLRFSACNYAAVRLTYNKQITWLFEWLTARLKLSSNLKVNKRTKASLICILGLGLLWVQHKSSKELLIHVLWLTHSHKLARVWLPSSNF